MMWWDTRNLSDPIDVLLLNTEPKDGGVLMGGSSLEYNTEAGPTKYLVGTEQGIVASVNLRNRKITNGVTINNGVSVYDCGPGKHHGPVHSIQRNPTHSKFFMTIGDWTAKIWAEDLKTPIITTNYHNHYLTGGCWSPTRPGVFYVIGMDGSLNVWDFFHRQSELAYSHKVGNTALSSIGIQGNTQVGGKLVAVGDVSGSVSLLEVCNSLASPQQNEKGVINSMFERETRREKNLEVRDRELRRSRAQAKEREKKKAIEQENNIDEETQKTLDDIEANFDTMLKDCNRT